MREADTPAERGTFEALRGQYNFGSLPNTEAELFTHMIVAEVRRRPAAVVLDIGCGAGVARRHDLQRSIAAVAGTMLGVEPDESVPAPVGFAAVERTTLENSALPAASVDVAYSWMVMEHVAEPRAFMARLHDILRPGGVYYFGTPNGRHYFTRAARVFKALHLEEFVLKRLRPGVSEQYHYPVVYRFNDAQRIDRIAAETGFERPEYVYLENNGPEGYMRGPLKLPYHMLRWKRQVLRRPDVLLKLVGRLRKPGT